MANFFVTYPAGVSGGGGGGTAITSINGDTTPSQLIQAASTGTDFTISTAAGITTVAIPSASGTARGLVTTGTQTFAGQKTFSTGITGNLTGNASGTAASFTGSLVGDVTGTQGATVLSATTNGTLTSLSALTTASVLASVGTITSGVWNAGAVTSSGNIVTTQAFIGSFKTDNATTGTITLTAYSVANQSSILFNGSASITAQGFAGGIAGQVLHVYNSSGNAMVFNNLNAGGTQKFVTPGGTDFSVSQGGGVTMSCNGSGWFLSSK